MLSHMQQKEWTAELQSQREMQQECVEGIQLLHEQGGESEWVAQKIRSG